MTGHSIALTLDADGVHAEFDCLEPDDGWCHQTCAFGCDISDRECLENHPREQVDYCNPIEYLATGDIWYEQYIGEETEPRSGPVVFEWTSDNWYGWRYDDADQQLNIEIGNGKGNEE